VNRTEFKQHVERKLENSSRLWDWPDTREELVTAIMEAHDRAVEAALEEYEQALNDDTETSDTRQGRSSLECTEDVSLHEVREPN